MSQSRSPARMLQKRTGWKYQECLRCVREMTSEAIEMLIKMRADAVRPGVQVTFDDGSRAHAHERVDRWMALYGLERHPRSAQEYQEIDVLAVSKRIRGSAKRDA